MESKFEKELRSNLILDINDLNDEFKIRIENSEKELKRLLIEYEEINGFHSASYGKLSKHLLIPKAEIKLDKKGWKLKRKELKEDYSSLDSKLKKLDLEISVTSNNIENLKAELVSGIDQLKSDVKKIIATMNEDDLKVVSGLELSPLVTKIKIVDKSYETHVVSRNPRVGMSLGTNFKPRVYISGAATKKTKTVMTSKEQYDIRKQDNFEVRVEEIAEALGLNNSSVLYDFLVQSIKKSQGSQYLSEYLSN